MNGKRKSRKPLWKRKWSWVILALIAFVYVNNSSFLAKESDRGPFLLAHRGMAQTFHMEGITDETCTAERIYPPEHPYLENTLSSMQAAFEAGAAVVELDVQPTKDGTFAVFHDWTLVCRTNGEGVTRDFSLDELQKLDIGYNYTADQGATFPFRGKGIGLMPSLDDVFKQFPNQPLLIHVKSNDPTEGILLAEYLSAQPKERQASLTVYGGDEPIAALHEQLPDMRVMSKASLKSCLIPYLAVGWTGYIPEACSQTQLHIPDKLAPLLWGWPNRFMERMDEQGTRVILVAGSGDVSSGFDSLEDLKRIPKGFSGGIWTNRIDRISAAYPKTEKRID
ncbi:glycerophosphodiester phosphodiesterase family protein [Brevibacillus choshinensis]|uniref:Glycerophosphodiester phosphodiesterase n=1 Tax=Brevibacillus choshinensis TaxID=54911 RepID=A0ABX7FIM8_BRECH|nr:glycerophosphodiester phosphodiesterase family protein [Brevibacillus choshinensis]QRG65122.1 glycerophosphodiester phosphodiesterase [Brevibacillus choshinensis]